MRPWRRLLRAPRRVREDWVRTRELLARLRGLPRGRFLVPVDRLRGRLLRLSGASSLLLEAGEGWLRLAVEWEPQARCRIELRAPRVVFAAGGAKEFSAEVRLEEGSEEHADRLVAALAGLVAACAWPWLAGAEELGAGLVERAGARRRRVELTALPPVRRWLLQRGRAAIEMISVRAVSLGEDGLGVSLGLPWTDPGR